MTEAERYEDTIAGLFAHIMMLRQELEGIKSHTHDLNTRMQLHALLQRSLRKERAEEES